MPTARIGDIDIAYESQGEGPALLTIMGLTGSSGHWRDLPAHLADRFRVVTFDNRGAGKTSVPPGPYSTRQLAGDALGLLDHLGIEKTAVFGVSMGGMIAQELALRAPERVTKLVLGCTSPGGPAALPPEPDVVAGFGSIGQGGAEATVRRLLALNFSARFLEEQPDVFEELVQYGLTARMKPAGFQGQAAAVVGHDAASRLGALAVPTLILTGDLDRLIPAGNAKLLSAAIPGSHVVTFAGVGHMFWVEAAAQTEAAIRGFLGSGAPAE
jgi:pimeloyl-ACP methyl ester carboxylesterase